MVPLLFILTLWILVIPTTQQTIRPKPQAVLTELVNMVGCALGITAKEAENIYYRYGCNCGQNFENYVPKDEIDACCLIHDFCYGNLQEVNGPCPGKNVIPFYPGVDQVHVERFNFICNNATKTVKCDKANTATQCGKDVCQCDEDFAICLTFCPVATLEQKSKMNCDKAQIPKVMKSNLTKFSAGACQPTTTSSQVTRSQDLVTSLVQTSQDSQSVTSEKNSCTTPYPISIFFFMFALPKMVLDW